ncbi:hypothetical protein HC024_14755 [Methylococcaceae bacterium WWC4]|nr:hypothetical protein [Methylococcaceae bacterium WWC4]
MKCAIGIFLSLIFSTVALALQQTYPDYSDQVPDGYTGKKFHLSQNYPQALPTLDRPWEKIDFMTNPDQYLESIKRYIYEGMREANWEVDNNSVRKWYHVPWMHVGRSPREFVHGMTRERTSNPGELGPGQTERVQNWAVGFYNEYGGYTVGQVWKDPSSPNPSAARFPIGTVVAKILFTAATVEQVPELAGTVEWEANINSTTDRNSPKKIQKIRLLQMDFGVRDPRANVTTGWVFGTFVYDNRVTGKDGWDKMVPVGLMWGNDPKVTPTNVVEGAKLAESYLNTNMPAFAMARLGWGGRLNGPVDNSESSCLSCHSTAQWKPTREDMTPTGTEQERLHWFRNLKPDEAFTSGELSLDYSLQFAVSIQNFHNPSLNPAISPTILRFNVRPLKENRNQEQIELFDLGYPVMR